MRKFLPIVVMLMFIFSAPCFAADISGNWQLEMTNQMGQQETWALTIKADGGNLAINAVHPMFGDITGTGTISGNDVTMHLVVAGGIGKVVTDFEGKVTGNKMEGTRKVSYDHSEDAGGDSGGGAPGGAPEGQGAPGGEMPSGAPGGGAPGGAPEGGGAPGGGMPGGAGGGAPGGGGPEGGGAPGGGAPAAGDISDAWTAVRQ